MCEASMSRRHHRHDRRQASIVLRRQYPGLDDALAGACVSNCMSSHICSAGDSTCQCSSTDNQRVLGCLSMSCSDTDAASFRDSIVGICGQIGLSSSSRTAPASTTSTKSRITSTRRPTRTRTKDAVSVSRARLPLETSEAEEDDTRSKALGSDSLTSSTALPPPSMSAEISDTDDKGSSNTSSASRGTFFAVSTTASSTASSSSEGNSSRATSVRFSQSSRVSVTRSRSSSEAEITSGGGGLPTAPSSDWQSLSLGAIVGIVIGAVAGAALLVALLLLARRRKRRREAARVSVMRAVARREELEKDDKPDISATTPIYSMYAGRSPALQQAAGSLQNASDALSKTNMSFLDIEPSSRSSKAPPASRASSRKSWAALSKKSGRSSRSKYSSRFTPKWIDMKRGSQASNEVPEFASTPSSFVLSRSFSMSGTTSYFAKLLGRDPTGFGARPAARVTTCNSHYSAEGLMSPVNAGESDYSAYPPEAPRGPISHSLSDGSASEQQRQTLPSAYSPRPASTVEHTSPSTALMPTNFIDASPNRSTHAREPSDVIAETRSIWNADRATMTRPSSVDLAWATSAGNASLPPGAAPLPYTNVPFVLSAGTPGPSRTGSMHRRRSSRRRMTRRASTRSSLPITPVSASSAYLSMIGAPAALPSFDGQSSVGPTTHFHTRLPDIREDRSDDSLPAGAVRAPSGFYIYSPEQGTDSPALASSQGSSRRTSVPTPSTLNSKMGRAL